MESEEETRDVDSSSNRDMKEEEEEKEECEISSALEERDEDAGDVEMSFVVVDNPLSGRRSDPSIVPEDEEREEGEEANKEVVHRPGEDSERDVGGIDDTVVVCENRSEWKPDEDEDASESGSIVSSMVAEIPNVNHMLALREVAEWSGRPASFNGLNSACLLNVFSFLHGDEILRASRTCRKFFIVSRSNDLWSSVVSNELPFNPKRDYLAYYVECNSKRIPNETAWEYWRKTEELEERIRGETKKDHIFHTASWWKNFMCLHAQPIMDIITSLLVFIFSITLYLQLNNQMSGSWWLAFLPLLIGIVCFFIRGIPVFATYFLSSSSSLPTYIVKRFNPRLSIFVPCMGHRRANHIFGFRAPRLHCAWFSLCFLAFSAFIFILCIRLEQNRTDTQDPLSYWVVFAPFLILCILFSLRLFVCWSPKALNFTEAAVRPDIESALEVSIPSTRSSMINIVDHTEEGGGIDIYIPPTPGKELSPRDVPNSPSFPPRRSNSLSRFNSIPKNLSRLSSLAYRPYPSSPGNESSIGSVYSGSFPRQSDSDPTAPSPGRLESRARRVTFSEEVSTNETDAEQISGASGVAPVQKGRAPSWLMYMFIGFQAIPPAITCGLLTFRFEAHERFTTLSPYIAFLPLFLQELLSSVVIAYYFGCWRRRLYPYSTLTSQASYFFMFLGLLLVGLLCLIFPVIIIQIVICEKLKDPSMPLWGVFLPIWYFEILVVALFVGLFLRQQRYSSKWKLTSNHQASLALAPAISGKAYRSMRENRMAGSLKDLLFGKQRRNSVPVRLSPLSTSDAPSSSSLSPASLRSLPRRPVSMQNPPTTNRGYFPTMASGSQFVERVINDDGDEEVSEDTFRDCSLREPPISSDEIVVVVSNGPENV